MWMKKGHRALESLVQSNDSSYSVLFETLGRKVPKTKASETVSEPYFTRSLYTYLAMSIIITVFNHKATYSY